MSVNWASAELGTSLVDFSSQVNDCEAQNVLESSMNSIWLTEEGLPQWFCLSLQNIQKSRDVVIRTVGWHCWHPYTTNPQIVTVHVSSDGSKFKQWDTFKAASPQRGTQLFCCAPISASIYPFLAFEVTETFGGNQTYLNRLFLYSDEIATSPPASLNDTTKSINIGNSESSSKVDRSDVSTINSDSIKSDKMVLQNLESVIYDNTTSMVGDGVESNVTADRINKDKSDHQIKLRRNDDSATDTLSGQSGSDLKEESGGHTGTIDDVSNLSFDTLAGTKTGGNSGGKVSPHAIKQDANTISTTVSEGIKSENQENSSSREEVTSSSLERNLYFERSNTGPALLQKQQKHLDEPVDQPDRRSVEVENEQLKKRISDLEGLMKSFECELSRLKDSPQSPKQKPPHGALNATQKSFQDHLHQYDHSSVSSTPPQLSRSSKKSESGINEQLSAHYAVQSHSIQPPLPPVTLNDTHKKSQNIDLPSPDRQISKPNSFLTHRHSFAQTTFYNGDRPENTYPRTVPLSPQRTNKSEKSHRENRHHVDEQDRHDKAINTMKRALRDEQSQTNVEPEKDIVEMIKDIDGKFKVVMKNLELKGLMGESFYGGHTNTTNSGSNNEATLHRGRIDFNSHIAQTSPLVIKGEGGRGPGGLFRPHLGPPRFQSEYDGAFTSSRAEKVNSLSAHTGPVNMPDKGINFFDSKRNIKSCQKPMPYIGNHLELCNMNRLSSKSSPCRVNPDASPNLNVSVSDELCRCSSSRKAIEKKLQGQAEKVNDEYEEILKELEEKVSQRVLVEAQLKVLQFVKKAENIQ